MLTSRDWLFRAHTDSSGFELEGGHSSAVLNLQDSPKLQFFDRESERSQVQFISVYFYGTFQTTKGDRKC